MSSKKLHYSSIGKMVDGTTYCAGVETLAENIIEDNEADATLVFPSKTGWASMRSSSYRMTTENVEAQLPLPIYKIIRFLIRLDNIKFTVREEVNREFFLSDFVNNETQDVLSTFFDITEFIFSAKEWETLPLAESTEEFLQGFYKDNTLYWEEGSNKVAILSTVYTLGTTILGGIFSNNTPTYERLVRSILYKNGADYNADNIYNLQKIAQNGGIVTNVREWQFRIEYVPMSSKTKIRARKNAPTKVEYIQPFNQRAEINAASAFGKNMYLTAQKTGCKEITLVKNYTKLKDIPPLGALVRHNGKKYRLVANHYVQTNTVYIQVTHTLSENWSEKSKHVSVDQKYRNWSIPQDTLWRNLYWEDYLRVGTSLKTSDDVTSGVALADIMQGLISYTTYDKTVDTFAWTTSEDLGTIGGKGTVIGATVPCSTYGIANSLIFSATFKDNLSAGLRATSWGDENYICEEAMYCKADGTLNKASVILGEGIKNYDSVCYPSICDNVNVIDAEVFNKEFYIYKDPGEALKFTYQIHLIGEDNCFFGNKFAEHNPLIKKWTTNRCLKFWALTHYAREGSDILETISGDTAYDHTTDGACFTVAELEQKGNESVEYGEVYTLTLSEAIITALQGAGYKAWAITDENNNLYVACNDASVQTLYFQLHHKR